MTKLKADGTLRQIGRMPDEREDPREVREAIVEATERKGDYLTQDEEDKAKRKAYKRLGR